MAPDLVPCVMLVKNNGPGANAPEAVTATTVTIKMNKSTINKNVRISIIIFKSKLHVCRTRKCLRDPKTDREQSK